MGCKNDTGEKYEKCILQRIQRRGGIIMAATNWTIIRKEKASNQIVTFNLEAKWTYKTALGIAIESNNDEIYELVCVVETHKMMPKNEKEAKKTK